MFAFDAEPELGAFNAGCYGDGFASCYNTPLENGEPIGVTSQVIAQAIERTQANHHPQ